MAPRAVERVGLSRRCVRALTAKTAMKPNVSHCTNQSGTQRCLGDGLRACSRPDPRSLGH